MKLAFDPAAPGIQGQELPIPSDWLRFLSPWSRAVFKQHDFGATLIQEMTCEDFGIFIWTLNIEKTTRLYPVANAPTIVLHFTVQGNISCVLIGFGRKLSEQGNYEMVYVPAGFNEAWFEPGMYESLHIELQPAYLEKLITIRPEIGELVTRQQNSSSKGMPMALAHIDYITSAILQNLRTCNKYGASLLLELRKYILELLSEYFNNIQQNEEDESRKNIHHKNLMIKIKNHILLAPNIHEHTLERLAKYFGTSESTLKREFKSLYNLTVSEFVRSQALAKSHYLLTTGKMSIDEIAEEIGYAWRPAFEEAFKKHFNYSPSRLRSGIRRN